MALLATERKAQALKKQKEECKEKKVGPLFPFGSNNIQQLSNSEGVPFVPIQVHFALILDLAICMCN